MLYFVHKNQQTNLSKLCCIVGIKFKSRIYFKILTQLIPTGLKSFLISIVLSVT